MMGKPIRILIDIGHPAHVHLFRNAIFAWSERGHDIVITIRDKDITARLLDRYRLSYEIVSKPRIGTLGLLVELIEHNFGVYRVAKRHKSELLLGTSVSITHVSHLIGGKAMVFNEDDASVVKAFTTLAYPLAHAIVTPTCLRENYGDRHIQYNGYQKLAYLHPNVFTPNPSILYKLGVNQGEIFFMMRLVALQAAHDKGAAGLSSSSRRKIIRALSLRGKVFITNEGLLPDEFEPYRMPINVEDMHDALAFATLLVSDSQTMTAEAAILGTPAIRCNTFVGRISYLEELEHRYQLTYGFQPEDEGKMYTFILNLLDQQNLDEVWQQRRDKMLSEKIDVNTWMIDVVENFFYNHAGD